jgi:hypothetical protein
MPVETSKKPFVQAIDNGRKPRIPPAQPHSRHAVPEAVPKQEGQEAGWTYSPGNASAPPKTPHQ